MWNAIRRTVYALIALFNFSVTLLLVYLFLAGHFGPRQSSMWDIVAPQAAGVGGIEYKDFISILLTALGLMVAILAAVMAVAAIWGFSVLKDATELAATKEAAAVAERESRVVAELVATRVSRELLNQVQRSTGDEYGEAGGADVVGEK